MKDTLVSTIYDILVVIDAETILATNPNPSTDPNNPTIIENPDKTIYSITKKNVTDEHLEKNFSLNAKPSDTLRCINTTLAGNSDYTCQWYDFKVISGNDLITSPTLKILKVKLPVPNPADPLHPMRFQTKTEYYWSTVVCQIGTAIYDTRFTIMDRSGISKGYFHFTFPLTIS